MAKVTESLFVCALLLTAGFAVLATPMGAEERGSRALTWADIPTWYGGDRWTYDVDGSITYSGYSITLTGTNVVKVLGNTSSNGHPTYVTNSSLSATGNYMSLVTIDIEIYAVTYYNMSDLSVLNMSTESYVDITTIMGSDHYYSKNNNTYSPAREEFDFPLQTSDQWEYNVSVTQVQDGAYNNYTEALGFTCPGSQSVVVPYGSVECLVISASDTTTRYYGPSVRNNVRSSEAYTVSGTTVVMNSELKAHTNATPAQTLGLALAPRLLPRGNVSTLSVTSPLAGALTVMMPQVGYVYTSTVAAGVKKDIDITSPLGRDNTPSISDYASFGVVVNVTSAGADLTGVITLATQAPDLVLEGAYPPASGTLGQVARINVSVLNYIFSNDLSVSGAKLDVYVDSAHNATLNVPALGPNAKANITFQWLCNATGTHTFDFHLDETDSIVELREDNNEGSCQLIVSKLNHRPRIIYWQPLAFDVSIDENETLRFNVTATDPDADPLGYDWYVDGARCNACANKTLLDFNARYLGANSSQLSPYNVTVVAYDDGAPSLNASHSWNLTVVNVNRPPVINLTLPASATPSVPENSSAAFAIDCFDPDNETLSMNWTVGGVLRAAGAKEFTLKTNYTGNMSAGWYLVTANVTDGAAFDSHTWNLTVLDLNRMPTVKIEAVRVGQTVNFSESPPKIYDLLAIASDPDGDSLNYTWYWTNDDNTTKIIGYKDTEKVTLEEGNNTYKVVVFDGKNGTASAIVQLHQGPLPFDDDVDDDVTTGSITIVSPLENAEFEPGAGVLVSGTVADIASGSEVEVTLGTKTATTTVGAGGNWSLSIQAPDTEGTHELKAVSANASDTVSIVVRTGAVDDDIDDDTDDDDTGGISPLFIILGIVIGVLLIVLIAVIVLVMMRRRAQAKAPEAAPAPAAETAPEAPKGADGAEAGTEGGPGEQADTDEGGQAPPQGPGTTPGPAEDQAQAVSTDAQMDEGAGTEAQVSETDTGADGQDEPQFDDEPAEEELA